MTHILERIRTILEELSCVRLKPDDLTGDSEPIHTEIGLDLIPFCPKDGDSTVFLRVFYSASDRPGHICADLPIGPSEEDRTHFCTRYQEVLGVMRRCITKMDAETVATVLTMLSCVRSLPIARTYSTDKEDASMKLYAAGSGGFVFNICFHCLKGSDDKETVLEFAVARDGLTAFKESAAKFFEFLLALMQE